MDGNTMDGSPTRGHPSTVVALVCFTVVAMSAGWKFKRHLDKKSELSAADEATVNQLI